VAVLQQQGLLQAAVGALELRQESPRELEPVPVVLRIYPAVSDLAQGHRLTAAFPKQGSI